MNLRYWGVGAIGAAVVGIVLAVAFWPTAAAPAVAIRDFAFDPAEIHISVGETVTWTNHDNVAHNVVFAIGEHGDEGHEHVEAELIQEGGSWSFTFNEAGTYEYHCHPHPEMTGVVVVG